MGTVAEKLGRLQETKAAIRTAIEAKGQSVADTDTFASYAEKIADIESGSTGAGTPPDPMKVYLKTRPADWLPMPEPQDDEMYLLFHIPDEVSSLIAFTATCTGNYTVETGTMVDGTFTAQTSASIASGAKYEAELFAEDYGDLTGDGFKQVMLKVSGTDILTWEPSTHSKKAAPSNFCGWNIMEIACRLPSGTRVVCGNTIENRALKKLRYFTWVGANSATSMYQRFWYCFSLTTVLQLDTSKVTNMSSMFYKCCSLAAIPPLNTSEVTDMYQMFQYCYSLTAIPQMDTSKVTGMNSMFCGCYSLTAIPPLNTSNVTDMYRMFNGCYSLTAVPELDTSKVKSISGMFGGCFSLTTIPPLDTSKATSMSNLFEGCYALMEIPPLNTSKVIGMSNLFKDCYSLGSVRFKPEVTNWTGIAISFAGCSLSHAAIVQLFESLPTITAAKAITLTGNPGVGELTDAEKAIATQKGWTLTL